MNEKKLFEGIKCETCTNTFMKLSPNKSNKILRLELREYSLRCPNCKKNFCENCFKGQLLCPDCIDSIPTSIHLKISNWIEKSFSELSLYKNIYLIIIVLSTLLPLIIPAFLIIENVNVEKKWYWVGYVFLILFGILMVYYASKFLLIGEYILEWYTLIYFGKILTERALEQINIDETLEQLKFSWKAWRIMIKMDVKKLMSSIDPIEYFQNLIPKKNKN